jgi:hypothetical protein
MPSADQAPAFDNASTLVGCPDRRIDRFCITCCSPSQPSHHAGCPARSRLPRKCDGIPVSFTLGHHGPGHPRNLIGERNGGDLGRAPRQQRREPGPMLGAMDLGVADDGECSSHEQAAQIAVRLRSPCLLMLPSRSLPPLECWWGRAQSRPRSYVLIGKFWGQQHLRPGRLPAWDRPRECNEGVCSSGWTGAKP